MMTPQHDSPVAVCCGLLIADPRTDPVADGVVVIRDGRVAAAGPRAETRIPEDALVLDAEHTVVMPGMVDTHGHITANLQRSEGLAEQFTADLVTASVRGVANLGLDLASGVTTMRTLGDQGLVEARFKEAIARGEVEGPRLEVAVRALRPSHGTAAFIGVAADGPDEIRKRIRENFHMNADVVKLFVSNVMNGPCPDDYLRGDLTEVASYSQEEIQTAVNEAHRLGMRVAGHGIGGPAMRWAIEAGIDSIEHANLMTEDDIELFLGYGTYLSDPNLQLFFDEETSFASHASWTKDWWREKVSVSAERTQQNLSKAVAAGVKVCLAIDSNHGLLWKEAQHFVEVLGATPRAALEAVTTNGADLLGLSGEIGTLEPGKRADLIALDGSPLEDITALRRVRWVMQDGVRRWRESDLPGGVGPP